MVSHGSGRHAVMRKALAVHGRDRASYFFSSRHRFRSCSPAGELFEENADLVVETVNGLADEESRLCYLSRLKALMLGDRGSSAFPTTGSTSHPVVQGERAATRVCEGRRGRQRPPRR